MVPRRSVHVLISRGLLLPVLVFFGCYDVILFFHFHYFCCGLLYSLSTFVLSQLFLLLVSCLCSSFGFMTFVLRFVHQFSSFPVYLRCPPPSLYRPSPLAPPLAPHPAIGPWPCPSRAPVAAKAPRSHPQRCWRAASSAVPPNSPLPVLPPAAPGIRNRLLGIPTGTTTPNSQLLVPRILALQSGV